MATPPDPTVGRAPFGVLRDGRAVERLTLTHGALCAHILTFGARLQALRVPDRAGRGGDVVLGYDELAGYEADPHYHGATIGRFSNRIGGAAFVLDGTRYPLAANDGTSHLHGGVRGFDRRLWTVEALDAGDAARAVLGHVSPDGEEGYPGTLRVQAIYTLEADALTIEYRATTDRPTIVGLTHHGYFDLGGTDGPHRALDQHLTIAAHAYTPADAGGVPTSAVVPLAGTPLSFAEARPIASAGDVPYDHNYIIEGVAGTLRPAARLADAGSGRVMDVLVTAPGLQFYAGRYLTGGPPGKHGRPYRPGDGVCLEPQAFPDAPNRSNFPSARLDPGDRYLSRIVLRFSTDARSE